MSESSPHRESNSIDRSSSNDGVLLIVDDDSDFNEVLCEWIRNIRDDLIVLQAYNRREAVKFASRYHPKLVILDIDMKPDNGITTCRELRCVSDESHVVGLTGVMNSEERREMLSAGADEVISKTANPTKLVFRLNSYLPPHTS